MSPLGARMIVAPRLVLCALRDTTTESVGSIPKKGSDCPTEGPSTGTALEVVDSSDDADYRTIPPRSQPGHPVWAWEAGPHIREESA